MAYAAKEKTACRETTLRAVEILGGSHELIKGVKI